MRITDLFIFIFQWDLRIRGFNLPFKPGSLRVLQSTSTKTVRAKFVHKAIVQAVVSITRHYVTGRVPKRVERKTTAFVTV